mmetsp:Transcript_4178/g.17632  ORF Transcript_4178/g.17632 Transcript_4178/m.17632 type:complete len:327 (+) Transcript_4178:1358-2338(+)
MTSTEAAPGAAEWRSCLMSERMVQQPRTRRPTSSRRATAMASASSSVWPGTSVRTKATARAQGTAPARRSSSAAFTDAGPRRSRLAATLGSSPPCRRTMRARARAARRSTTSARRIKASCLARCCDAEAPGPPAGSGSAMISSSSSASSAVLGARGASPVPSSAMAATYSPMPTGRRSGAEGRRMSSPSSTSVPSSRACGATSAASVAALEAWNTLSGVASSDSLMSASWASVIWRWDAAASGRRRACDWRRVGALPLLEGSLAALASAALSMWPRSGRICNTVSTGVRCRALPRTTATARPLASGARVDVCAMWWIFSVSGGSSW